MLQKIDENIDIILIYKNNSMFPVKFRWNDKHYPVKRINNRWVEREGSFKKYFFTLSCGKEEVYEVYLHTKNMNWKLNAINQRLQCNSI